MNILFTCAGRRNYLINYFKDVLNGNGKVFASDMQLTAPALVDADVALQVPGIYDTNYIPTLLDIVTKHSINLIISLNDLELPLLSAEKEKIEALGAMVVVSSESVINIAFDKWETIKFLEKIGLKSPKTYLDLESAKQALLNGELKFPLVIKPRWGSASIGIDFPEDINELELAYRLQNIRLKRTILAEASKEDMDHAILIQEKINGPEYGMDVLNDFDGNYFGTYVRQKLSMRAGETDKAISVIDDRFEKIGEAIGNNLGHIGNLDCDVLERDGELYVLELNPRFGGGYPFSHEAGMNTPAIYLAWLAGQTQVEKLVHYKAGIMSSKCDRLIRVN